LKAGLKFAISGYAFEQVCLAHIKEIKKALGISGVQTTSASWVKKAQKASSD
jgi:transposase-like protein